MPTYGEERWLAWACFRFSKTSLSTTAWEPISPAKTAVTDCVTRTSHHQRELTYLQENLDQIWASEMIELLLDAKDLAERELSREEGSRRVIGEGRLNKILSCYFDIIDRGYLDNPEPPPKPKGKKGPVKRSKSLILLRRMEKRWAEILGYFFYPGLYPYLPGMKMAVDIGKALCIMRSTKRMNSTNGTIKLNFFL